MEIQYRGLAYVVGVNEYLQANKLSNAVYDAKAIAAELKTVGFNVKESYDTDLKKFVNEFDNFKRELSKFNVGLFYFAGHGVEFEGKNYLLLTDSIADNETAIKHTTFDLQSIVNDMHKTGCKMNIQIIDACRNNPYGTGRGIASTNLAPVFAPQGTLIAYSTSPGETAMDGGMGKNSIYTGALLQHMKTKGLQIEDFFKQVRTTVYSLTGGKQTSWEHTSLIGKFCFNAGTLIHSVSVGYPDEAIKYDNWPVESRINQLKEDLLSGTFDKQRSALRKIKQINPKEYTRDEIFILGRSVMWAAFANCFDCQAYVENASEIADYYTGKENPFFDGMLFEMYFNHEGMFEYGDANIDYLDTHLKWTGREELVCSFDFIEKVLKPFERNLLFIPSRNPQMVTVNIQLVSDNISQPWGDEDVERIVSVKHDTTELLDSDILPIYYGAFGEMSFDNLSSIISKNFCIPSSRLKIITNKPECKAKLHLSVGLKKLQDLHKE